MNRREIDFGKSLNLYTICERRDCFLTILMFKSNYLDVELPNLLKEAYPNSCLYMGGKRRTAAEQISATTESIKRNYKRQNLICCS